MLAREEEKDTYIYYNFLTHKKKNMKKWQEIVIYDKNLVIYF